MTDRTCSACAHWQPEKTGPRMVALGFANCSKRSIPGHTVSGSAKYRCFAPMTQIQADNRAAIAAEKGE